ncbi:substrate-binding domain-containing protein [Paenibacillus sp. CF384]|uniref:GntR family transcriptional regulator n=1 Tax=Paenibacillus sp. CF384 TaxID=1884382 RepID=UPI00089A1EBF|nr:GntR family transcriptional regulator [Paenibacillus sp. CF384]SDX20609.1 GntR family transcriptional regulator, arabinose operon transcriptional repressor [Paenibacillus sp. CF384]
MQDGRIPIYQVIQDFIKNQIQTGVWSPGDKIFTEKELMEKFEVSRITVSNALTGLTKEGWLNRIQGKGSYVHDMALSLRSTAQSGPSIGMITPAEQEESRRNVIGLILPNISDFFSMRMNKGISKALKQSGYNFVLMLSENSKEREAAAIRELLYMGASGLIIFPVDAETYNEEILRLKLERFPLVIIDRYLTGIETHFIGSDGVEASRLAVNHLYELGHRDIAICSDVPLSTTTIEQRLSGYMKALKELGEMINPAMMLTDFYVDYEREELDEQHPLFRYVKNGLATAYITLNGTMALHLFRIVRHLGLEVPKDISIVTFDNLSPSREFNFFTYIDQHEETVGRLAAEQLLGLLDDTGKMNQQENKYRKLLIEPHLVSSVSTAGCPVRTKP